MKKRLISLLLALLLVVGVLPAGVMAADDAEEQIAVENPEADVPEEYDASGEDEEAPSENETSDEDEEVPSENEASGEDEEEAPAEDEISDEEEAPGDTYVPFTLSVRTAPDTITTAEDLAALAEAVNGGDSCEGQTITLAEDITLTGDWTPIGTAAKPFKGTFDGGYHVIFGLKVNASADNAGLFGYLAAEGTVKNLVVVGEVATTGSYAGGIVGTCEGTVENCGNRATVTGNSCIGGIVGQAGEGSVIRNCYNAGALSSDSVVGGIIGASSDCAIENCYNTGTVTGGMNGCGGIAGQCDAWTNPISNCYSIGKVTANDEYAGAIIGGSMGYLEDHNANCFYLEGSAPQGGFADGSGLTATAVTDLSTLAAKLGSAFVDGGKGYPVLAWEKNVTAALPAPAIKVKLNFTVTPADAYTYIRVEDWDNYHTPVQANEDGSYTVNLGGHYYYSITADGYNGKEGNITVTGNQTVAVTLEKIGSGPVTPPEEPDEPDDDPAKEHRDKALEELQNQYWKFNRNDYTAANWAALEAAYEKGVAAIKAAKPAEPPYIENNIIAALNAAIAAMQAVKSDPAGTVTVAVSMDANTLGLGYLIKPTLVEVPRNTKASVVITDLLKKNGYGFDYTGKIEDGFYLEGVEPVDLSGVDIPEFILDAVGGAGNIWYETGSWLGEFCFYNMSGWMYSVDGSFPGVGAASWNMSDGEVMRWQFTVYGYGADLNADNSAWGASSIIPTLGNKDALTWAVAELRAEKSDAELEKLDAYKNAMKVLQDPEATQREINEAYDALYDLDDGSGEDSSGTGEGADVTAKPAATVDKDGNANVSMEEEDISAIIDRAIEENADRIVIEPEVEGEASKVSVELPKSAVGDIVRETDAALSVKTDVGAVTIPAAGLEDLSRQSGSRVTVSAEAVKGGGDGRDSGETRFEVSVDGRAVEKISGGITVAVPAAETGSGNVLVIVNADGTEKIVKKSVVDGKTAAGIVDGSCTVKVVDNSKRFDDTANHWSREAVDFASAHELFGGTGANTFSPDTPMSRAMLATVLYRLEDAVASGDNPFDDVPKGAWYTDAVTWASNAGIITGTGSGFNPNGSVSREQLAAMLYRYAKTLGMSTGATGDLSGFNDGDKISAWAKDAMSWAVGSGLISGKGSGVLDPAGSATRAEVAVIMQRLIGLMVK